MLCIMIRLLLFLSLTIIVANAANNKAKSFIESARRRLKGETAALDDVVKGDGTSSLLTIGSGSTTARVSSSTDNGTATSATRRLRVGAGDFCFSGRATVNVFGKGTLEMKDLQVGDLVVTGSEKQRYQPVYAFGHYKEKAPPTEFLKIETFPFDRKKRAVEITGQHMIYLHGKPNPVRADSLKVGDVLRGDHNRGLTVTKISIVKRRDNYAPLTPHGTVVVDGIVASSYISLQEFAREHIELGESGFTVNLSQRVIVHVALSPYRMYCMGLTSNRCQSYNENGLPHYVAFGLKVADWGNAQHVLVQLFGLMAFFVILSPFVVVEDLAGPEYGPTMLLVIILTFILYKRSNYRVLIKIRHNQ